MQQHQLVLPFNQRKKDEKERKLLGQSGDIQKTSAALILRLKVRAVLSHQLQQWNTEAP